MSELISATQENLQEFGHPYIASWLISAAHNRTTITYGETKERLKSEAGFNNMHAASLGRAVGALMDNLLKYDKNLPMLNVLMVDQKDRVPGEGAYDFLRLRYGKKRVPSRNIRYDDLGAWRDVYEEEASNVYAYSKWKKVFKENFGRKLIVPKNTITELANDGDWKRRGNSGEGQHHKRLRLAITENPSLLHKKYANSRTKTEYELPSGDRLDVALFLGSKTIAVEVKSRISNEYDLQRGVYQCVKYKAVLEAMDLRSDPPVDAVLVVETEIPSSVKQLARRLGVTTMVMNISK